MSTAPEPAICIPCGRQYGRFDPTSVSVGTFWPGSCAWCGAHTSVTSPADYGNPKPNAAKAYVGDLLDD